MARGHQRQHSMRVALGQEATTNPELKDFTELQCWATRHHNSSLKRPAKKWVRLRDYTLYWCKSPVESQAEGCIRFLYDEVTPELVTDTQLKFKCRDKDRLFEFENKLDAQRWFDRTSKTLAIRNSNGASFSDNGKTIFNNVCNMFLLNNNEWIAVGQGTLKIISDTKDSGGVPDVAAIMTVPSDNGSKSYEFLVCPYIKPKGSKTWILPKTMDMNTDFNQQTLAFRLPSENDAQVFQNVFDNIFRSTDTDTKHDVDRRVKDLEEENRRLQSEVELLKKRCERLKEKKDALKKLLQRARVSGVGDGDMGDLDDDDEEDDVAVGDNKPQPQTPQDDKSFTPSTMDDNEVEVFDTPYPYKVVGEDGVTVRSSIDLSSDEVCIIPHGEIVLIKERRGRRGRLVTPVDGWCSLRTQGGYVCLQKVEGQEVNQDDVVADPQMEALLQQSLAQDNDYRGGRAVGGGGGSNANDRREIESLRQQLRDATRQLQEKDQEIDAVRSQASAGRGGGGGGANYTKQQVEAWTSREVGSWLDQIGLDQYANKFEELDVDGSILLLDLDENLLLNDLQVSRSDMDVILQKIQAIRMNTAGGGGGGATGGGAVDISAIAQQLNSGAFRNALSDAVRSRTRNLQSTVRQALSGGSAVKELAELKEKLSKYESGGTVSRYEYQRALDDARREAQTGGSGAQDTGKIVDVVQTQLSSVSREAGELRNANNLLNTELQRKDSRLAEVQRQVDSLRRGGSNSYY